MVPLLPERNAFRWMERLDSAGLREYQGYVRQARAATAKWARAGITIGTGTDIWQVPNAVHMELEEMVKAGRLVDWEFVLTWARGNLNGP